MLKYGIYVHLEAKPGKEAAVEEFLRSAQATAQEESKTVAWFAFREGPTTFGLFDAFEDEEGRDAHLNGKIATAAKAKAAELFVEEPKIRKFDFISSKVPGFLKEKEAA